MRFIRSTAYDLMNLVRRIADEIRKYHRQGGKLVVGGQLAVTAEVDDLGFEKRVGIRYTTDNWATCQDSDGTWSSHDAAANTDQFLIYSEPILASAASIEYALYYHVKGTTFWDNNQGVNYLLRF
jgi:hypothetical protein